MTTHEKAICAALILMTWAALVFAGKVPAQDFVQALRDVLIALGVFQISKGA